MSRRTCASIHQLSVKRFKHMHLSLREQRGGREINKQNTSWGLARKVQMYYSVWLQLQLDVTEFTKEGGETTAVT